VLEPAAGVPLRVQRGIRRNAPGHVEPQKRVLWDLLLLVLHHSPEAARKKHGLPTNNPFLPIHAAVEMRRDNLSTTYESRGGSSDLVSDW